MGDFACWSLKWSITDLIELDVTYWASIITLSQILDCNCDWFMISIFGKNVSFAFFSRFEDFSLDLAGTNKLKISVKSNECSNPGDPLFVV